jgi:hypothetical protein
MPKTNSVTAATGVAVVLAGGVLAVARAFNQQSNAPALAGDLETLLRYTFEVAPVAVVLLVGLLIINSFDII